MTGSRGRGIRRVPEEEVMGDDREAVAYEAGDFRLVNGGFVRRLLRDLGGDRGRALDLGTGPADIPIRFCTRARGWRVTAVDLSPAMLRLAARAVKAAGLERRIELVQGDAKRLRGAGRRFDLVFSNSLLHHVSDPLAFWREIRRLVRPGGRVVVMDLRRPPSRPAARGLVERHAKSAPPLLRQLFHRSLLAAYTPPEVRAQLAAAGLEGLRVRATTDRHLVVEGRVDPKRGRASAD